MGRKYITENALLKEREMNKKGKKERKTIAVLTTLKAFAAQHYRRKKKNHSLDQARGFTFILPLDDLITPSPYDPVWLLVLSLNLSS